MVVFARPSDRFLFRSRMAAGPCTFPGTRQPLLCCRPPGTPCSTDMPRKPRKPTGTLRRLPYVSRLLVECYNHPIMYRPFRPKKFLFLRFVFEKLEEIQNLLWLLFLGSWHRFTQCVRTDQRK